MRLMDEIDKLAWLCIQDKRLLCARSKGKDTFYIPGGKREAGESDQAALIREIKEELSVDIIPETIKYACAFKEQAHDKPSEIQVKITCYTAEFTGQIQANAEIEEVVWLTNETKLKCSLVARIIIDWLQSEGMIE
jgi:8-oxo-dGTP diphosphatase